MKLGSWRLRGLSDLALDVVGIGSCLLTLNALVACASKEEPEAADEPSTTEPSDDPTADDVTQEPTSSEATDTSQPPASTPSATATPSETGGDMPPSGADAPTRGAFSLHVVPKGDCSVGDTWIDFPKVAGGHPVTATEHPALAEDLTRDAEGFAIKMQCEWTVTEDPYTALIGISSISDTSNGVFVSMTAVLSDTGPQQSRLLVRRNDQETQYAAVASGEQCDVTLLDVDMDAQTVWASLTCTSLKDREETEECAATEGYFYFENCKPRQ
jgi:hypothetical protein